jgi:N-acetylneuraminic acid mutarotase
LQRENNIISKESMMKNTILVVLILVLGIASVSLAQEGTWTTKADMPTARMYLSTSVVNGKIYAIGGSEIIEVGVSTVEKYYPATDTWTTKSPMPTPRWGLSTSVVKGKIYAIGGAPGFPIPGIRTVEEYDPATDTWTRKSPMPTARWSLSTSVVNGKIYAIGGEAPTGSRTMDEYDPATDTWTRKASMEIGRYAFSTSVVNGKIYAIGGVTSYPSYTSSVEEYDPATDTWTRKANMPMARTFYSTCMVNGKIYTFGGAPHPDRDPLPVMYEYDPTTDTWTTKADMLTARTGLATSTVNGKIYAIGGSTTGYSSGLIFMSTVEEYDPIPLVFDFNSDGIVDSVDMRMIVNYWHTDEPAYDIAPIPFGDGIVDVQDLVVFAEHLFEDYRVVAHWKLDETEGNIAYDSAGNNDDTVNGEPAWQPIGGKVGGALEFDGIDDYVNTDFVLDPADKVFSAFAWIKGGLSGQVIISQTDGLGFGGSWFCIDSSSGKLTTMLMDPQPPLVSESVITDGVWHHIGLLWDGSLRYLYVDGAEVARDAVALSYTVPCNGSLYLGAGKNLDTSSFFSGMIDDVRIYNVALSTEEIAALEQ